MLTLRPLRQPLRFPLRLKPYTCAITTPTTPFSSRVYAHVQACAHTRAPAQILYRSYRSVSSNKGFRRSGGLFCRSGWRSGGYFLSGKGKL